MENNTRFLIEIPSKTKTIWLQEATTKGMKLQDYVIDMVEKARKSNFAEKRVVEVDSLTTLPEEHLMQTDAIVKIRNEMQFNNANAYVQKIGTFLIRYLVNNPLDEKTILNTDKTILQSMDAMKTEAMKKQQDGMAMLTDEEGFAIVLKYFGIESAA